MSEAEPAALELRGQTAASSGAELRERARTLYLQNQRIVRAWRRVRLVGIGLGTATLLAWLIGTEISPMLPTILAFGAVTVFVGILAYQGHRRERFLAALQSEVEPSTAVEGSPDSELACFVRATSDARFGILSARQPEEVTEALVAWGLEARELSESMRQAIAQRGVRLGIVGELAALTPGKAEARMNQVVELDAFLSWANEMMVRTDAGDSPHDGDELPE